MKKPAPEDRRSCRYCGEIQYEKVKHTEFHECSVANAMVPFVPILAKKDKDEKVVRSVKQSKLVSWGETPGSDDPLLGAPTRYRQ